MKSLILAAIIVVTAGLTQPAMAASQAECKIWLCLPGGFPSDCGDAHSAMKKRIKKGRAPLPPFHECTADSSSSMTYKMGTDPVYGTRKQCSSGILGKDSDRCLGGSWILVRSNKIIANRDFITVYVDGEPAGSKYYWRTRKVRNNYK